MTNMCGSLLPSRRTLDKTRRLIPVSKSGERGRRLASPILLSWYPGVFCWWHLKILKPLSCTTLQKRAFQPNLKSRYSTRIFRRAEMNLVRSNRRRSWPLVYHDACPTSRFPLTGPLFKISPEQLLNYNFVRVPSLIP